jgi:hypothetical protein
MCVLALLALTAPAAVARTQFSADTVQTIPGGQVVKGKVYVGAEAMRMEQEAQGRHVIQIFVPGQGLAWMIDPQQKIYHEMRGAPAPAGGGQANPCEGMPGFSCRKMGAENVAGRNAEKWEMTGALQGKALSGAVWLDVERRTPLRQQGADGSMMEMKLLGREALNGRDTEKWEMSLRSSDGRSQRALQWYDPELAYTVRDEMPGGLTNELRNIRVGPLPPELFQLPAGYQKRDLPPPAAGAATVR